MLKLDEIQKRLLREVADLHEVPEGAYNIRSNSKSAGRQSTAHTISVPTANPSGGSPPRISRSSPRPT